MPRRRSRSRSQSPRREDANITGDPETLLDRLEAYKKKIMSHLGRCRSRSRERKSRSDRSDRVYHSDRHRRSRSHSPAPRLRSRSPVPRRRSRSSSRTPRRKSPLPRSRRRSPGPRNRRSKERNSFPERRESQCEEWTQEDRYRISVMGFAGFDTTKDKTVVGNNMYIASITRGGNYRQYLNRRDGSDRPLA